MPRVSDERRKQRWRRRKLLIVDESSMLDLDTLYEIDQKLRFLRGFHDLDFGGCRSSYLPETSYNLAKSSKKDCLLTSNGSRRRMSGTRRMIGRCKGTGGK